MQLSLNHRARASSAFTPVRIAAVAALALACSQPARAIVFWDEVTLYLTHATYTPGETVDTTFYFGSKPAVDLSAFDFTLTWDTPLAAPVSKGAGSVAEWMTALDGKGSTAYGFSGPQSIKGSWVADASGGTGSFISTSYDNLKWAVFRFETSAALTIPFIVNIELTNIRDSGGDVMDLGSGFLNWAHISPVPEPAGWTGLLFGLAALACLNRRALRR